MPRKFTASESQLKPDARYQDKVVAKFINCMMYGGQKGPATRVVYDAFDEIQTRLDKDKNENMPKTAIEPLRWCGPRTFKARSASAQHSSCRISPPVPTPSPLAPPTPPASLGH